MSTYGISGAYFKSTAITSGHPTYEIHPTYAFNSLNQVTLIGAYAYYPSSINPSSSTMTITTRDGSNFTFTNPDNHSITTIPPSIASGGSITQIIVQFDSTKNVGIYITPTTSPATWPTFVSTFSISSSSNPPTFSHTIAINGYNQTADFLIVDTSSCETLIAFPNADTVPNNKAIFIKDKSWKAATNPIYVQCVNQGRIDNKSIITLNQNGSCLSLFSDLSVYYISSMYPTTNPGPIATTNVSPSNALGVQSNSANAFMNMINVYNTDIPPLYPNYGSQRETGKNVVILPSFPPSVIIQSLVVSGSSDAYSANVTIPSTQGFYTGDYCSIKIIGDNNDHYGFDHSKTNYGPITVVDNNTLTLPITSTQQSFNLDAGMSITVESPTHTYGPALCMVVYAGGVGGQRTTYPLGFVTSDWQSGSHNIDNNPAYSATAAPCISSGQIQTSIISSTSPDTVTLASSFGLSPKTQVTFGTNSSGFSTASKYYVANTYSVGSVIVPLASTSDGGTPLSGALTVPPNLVYLAGFISKDSSVTAYRNYYVLSSAYTFTANAEIQFNSSIGGVSQSTSYYVTNQSGLYFQILDAIDGSIVELSGSIGTAQTYYTITLNSCTGSGTLVPTAASCDGSYNTYTFASSPASAGLTNPVSVNIVGITPSTYNLTNALISSNSTYTIVIPATTIAPLTGSSHTITVTGPSGGNYSVTIPTNNNESLSLPTSGGATYITIVGSALNSGVSINNTRFLVTASTSTSITFTTSIVVTTTYFTTAGTVANSTAGTFSSASVTAINYTPNTITAAANGNHTTIIAGSGITIGTGSIAAGPYRVFNPTIGGSTFTFQLTNSAGSTTPLPLNATSSFSTPSGDPHNVTTVLNLTGWAPAANGFFTDIYHRFNGGDVISYNQDIGGARQWYNTSYSTSLVISGVTFDGFVITGATLTGNASSITPTINAPKAYIAAGEGTKSSGIVFFSEGTTGGGNGTWYIAGYYDPSYWSWKTAIPTDYGEYYSIPSPPSQFALTISANVNSYISLPDSLNIPITIPPTTPPPYLIIAKSLITDHGDGNIGFSTYSPGNSNLFNDSGVIRIAWNGQDTVRPCVWFVSETRSDESFVRYYPILSYSP